MTSDTRVCFIYCSPVEEDASRFATLPVKRMARVCAGASISIHAVYSGALDAGILQDVGVTTHKVSPPRSDNPLLKAPWLFQTARTVVRDHDIDVLTNVWAHYEMAPVAAASGRANVVLRIVGEPISNPTTSTALAALRGRVGRQLERVSIYTSDAVYFNSHSLKDRFDTRFSLPSRAPVISQGVDTERFAPKKVHEPAPKEPTFLFAGRLDSRRKGVGRTVRAFARYRDRNEKGRLVLAGRGELHSDVRSIVETLDDVDVIGHLPHEELAAYYRKATALLLLSESEALPNVVLEAMASGLPVIATPVGDVPMLLDSNRGHLIMEDDVDSVVSEMERLAKYPELRRELSSNAREYVERNHSFDAVGDAFVRLFKERVN